MTALHASGGARARRVATTFVLASMTLLALARPATAAAATTVQLVDVSKSLNVGDTDGINVALRDGSNAFDTTYTGTATFTSDCGTCFTITPNNGGANARAYTYTGAADGGNKSFSLVWTQAGTHTLTVTATLAGGGTAADTEEGIVVGASTTSSSSTSSTTSTTVTSSSSSSTSSTTTTTAVACTAPRVVASPAIVSQKDSVTLTGSCYPANTIETIVLTSSPVVLGGVRSGATGTFTAVVVIPANTTAGAHTLTVGGPGGSASVGITVTGLPVTGGGGVNLLGLALAAMFAGLVLIAGRRLGDQNDELISRL